jgi:CelD/BcsL family acetyltransferase involved in cellulose biosynthesis
MPLENKVSGGSFSLADPLSFPDWDRQIASLSGAAFFHTAAWARVLVETYGYSPQYLIARAGERLAAVLPLMEISSWLTGRRGVSLPFTDLVEPLGDDPATLVSLHAEARRRAKECRWKYLELRGGGPWLAPASPSTRFYRHVLDLRAGATALWGRCDESVRRAVRKAERSGLKVEFSTEETAVREFFALFCQTRRKHGAPPQPFRFFASIQKHVLQRGLGWVALARHEGRPVAAAIYFHSGPHALYKFGGSDETRQHLRGNNLVMWAAIEKYAREGFASFDFGRTSLDNEGLRKFKASWGAVESDLDYWRYDVAAEKFVNVPDRASGPQAALFRALPAPMSRLVGRLAYRHIG